MNDILAACLSIILAVLILATVRTHRQNARAYTYIRPAELRSALLADCIESSDRVISETARSAEEAQMGADRP